MLLHQQLCPEKNASLARNVTIKVSSTLHIICLWVPLMCVVNSRMNCGSSSDENRINEYTSKKKGRTYEGLCFCISSCAQKKGLVCWKCDDQSFVEFANHCLWVPSMCDESIKTNCGSSSDRSRVNEYTSNKKGCTYEGLRFCISKCGHKKRLVCSKCDAQSLLKFAQHLPLGSVNVW